MLGAGATAGAQEPPAGTPTTTTPATTTPLATTPPTSTIPTTTVVADTSGRQWLVPVPTGCEVPELPAVVFVGTLLETGTPAGAPEVAEFETARFKVDQARAGAVERYSYGGVIDVRYGIDTKYLDEGERYLVGASVDPTAGVLVSKVQEVEPQFGGDEVIGAAESDVTCPVIDDPVRTLDLDGTSVDAGVISPLLGAKRSMLRPCCSPRPSPSGSSSPSPPCGGCSPAWARVSARSCAPPPNPERSRAATRTRPNARPD